MINILPPEVKQQISYAKRNAQLIRYLGIAITTFAALGVLLVFSLWYGSKQIENYNNILAERAKQHQTYEDTQQKVDELQSNLETIDKLLNERTKYSALLSDFAAALPPNSYINHMQLTGDDSEPLELLVTTDSFNRAAEVRNGLIQSDRIKSADIQSVSEDEQLNNYVVVLVLAFEEGKAR